MVTIRTLPASPERWDDIVTVFGRRGEDPGWCWCQRFMEAPIDGTTVTDNRDALRHEIQSASVPPGVLAYVDESPAGWARVMPRGRGTPRPTQPGVAPHSGRRRWRVVDHLLCRGAAVSVDRSRDRLARRSSCSRSPSRRHRTRGPSRRHRRPDGRQGERLRIVHRNDADVPRQWLPRDRPHLPKSARHATRSLNALPPQPSTRCRSATERRAISDG